MKFFVFQKMASSDWQAAKTFGNLNSFRVSIKMQLFKAMWI